MTLHQKIQKRILKFLIFLFFIPCSIYSQSSPTGIITGTVVETESGEPLFGANIYLVGTNNGTASDMKGHYRIVNIPAGTYTLKITYMGFKPSEITDVTVKPKKVTEINVSMIPEAIQGEKVTVSAKAIRNTEAILLKDRQKSATVSDAISTKTMSRTGSGNAAEAMNQVTGASVVDGRYIFIRGLGDRYTSTQLNGIELPGTDPYKRSANVDIISSALLDNIVTTKSFTPDKPGNFSGGTVDIHTKDFPNNFNLSFSASTSYNTQTSFNDNGLSIRNAGDLLWLGMSDGSMDIPEVVPDTLREIDIIRARTDSNMAQYIDQTTKAFNNSMSPKKMQIPLNQKYSFSIGNQTKILGKTLGYIGSVTYNRSYNNYDSGTYARWVLKAYSDQATGLENIFNLNDHQTVDEVLWGANLKTSLKLSPVNIMSLTVMHNQNGLSKARLFDGAFPYDLKDEDTYKVYSQQYNERRLSSYQLHGEHLLKSLKGTRVDWNLSFANSIQDEPDHRFFTYYQTASDNYGVKTNIPQERYFRYLDEDRYEGKFDITLFENSKTGNIKFGMSSAYKTRVFTERRFKYEPDSDIGTTLRQTDGDIYELFDTSNLGQTGTWTAPDSNIYNLFGIYIQETEQLASNYSGDQYINAGYIMADVKFLPRLRFIGGLRFETTDMKVISKDPDEPKGIIKTEDYLPSVNFIYSLHDNMNVRLAYSKTLARPSFREISSFVSYDFKEGDKYQGNQDLKRTLIDNVDFRWEWFTQPGELLALSVFYKKFYNPIEMVIKNNNYWLTWENVDEALSYGLEFEVRKNLEIITSKLKNFSFGTNVSLIHSQVDINPQELALIRETNPEAESTRPFQGQSPYLLNVILGYDNYEMGLSSSIYFNIFGERLAAIGKGSTPDVYEQPAETLNFTLSKKIFSNISLKFSAKNLLDSEEKKLHEFKNKIFISQLHRKGRTFSLGINYNIN
ncbi:MAG: TonB-dependent receptor [bacterium]